VSPDRLQHCLWPYLDPTFPNYDAEKTKWLYPLVQQHFSFLDDCIGQLLAKLVDKRTSIFVISDHGFRGVNQQMVINY
jgi:predicted AlkP superfamily phosphohydrolase/phosphomutase